MAFIEIKAPDPGSEGEAYAAPIDRLLKLRKWMILLSLAIVLLGQKYITTSKLLSELYLTEDALTFVRLILAFAGVSILLSFFMLICLLLPRYFRDIDIRWAQARSIELTSFLEQMRNLNTLYSQAADSISTNTAPLRESMDELRKQLPSTVTGSIPPSAASGNFSREFLQRLADADRWLQQFIATVENDVRVAVTLRGTISKALLDFQTVVERRRVGAIDSPVSFELMLDFLRLATPFGALLLAVFFHGFSDMA